jgi:hypothetical protein
MTTLKRGVYEQKGTIGKLKSKKVCTISSNCVHTSTFKGKQRSSACPWILPLLALPFRRFVIVFRILMGILHRTVKRTIWI